MKLVFATNNIHKLREARSVLSGGLEIAALSDIGCTDELPETSGTFMGNALQKARYVFDKFGVNCFADDSGLEVDALHGSPGIYSARYAGTRDSNDNIKRLLAEMKGEGNRHAQFRTVVVSIIEGEQKVFEGIIRGSLTLEAKGVMGFGYDPVFIPDGYSVTFAEMNPEEKNAISHRALALKEFSAYLTRQLLSQKK